MLEAVDEQQKIIVVLTVERPQIILLDTRQNAQKRPEDQYVSFTKKKRMLKKLIHSAASNVDPTLLPTRVLPASSGELRKRKITATASSATTLQ